MRESSRPPAAPRRERSTRSQPASRSRGGEAAIVVNHLRHLFQAIREYSKAMERSAGLSSPQAWALRILHEQPGLSLGELARRMYSHPSTVCGVVDRLVEREMVTRKVNRSDRRGVVLALTPAGRRLLKASPPPVQVGLARALEAVPRARLRQLAATLAEIVRRTQADRLEAPFFDASD